jgi:hypothetical protein
MLASIGLEKHVLDELIAKTSHPAQLTHRDDVASHIAFAGPGFRIAKVGI